MRKKVLGILLCSALALGALTGCGESDDSSRESPDASPGRWQRFLTIR